MGFLNLGGVLISFLTHDTSSCHQKKWICLMPYTHIFTTEVEPKLKGKGLSARDKRVLVTHIVAKAHSLTISAGNATRHEIFKRMGYLPADPSEIKLRVLPSYTFVAMSDVEQGVQQMVAARAEALPEPDPVYNVPLAKHQASITAYFHK